MKCLQVCCTDIKRVCWLTGMQVIKASALIACSTDRQFSRVGTSAYCQLWLIATCCHQPRMLYDDRPCNASQRRGAKQYNLEVDSNVYQARRDSCATDKSGTPVSMTNVPCPCRRTLRQIGRSRHVCHIQYA